MMDLETFIIIVYVWVDEWYQQEIASLKQKRGRPPKMSDSEILTLALVSQWRVGVPWQSERGFIRYAHAHLTHLFGTLLQRSAFNHRVRHLYGVLVRLQTTLARRLHEATDLYEVVDCIALPAYSLGHSKRQSTHWFWSSATKGWARGTWFIGHKLLMSVCRSGAITGWLIGAGHLNDRWLLEGLLSGRQRTPQLREPTHPIRSGKQRHTPPPVGFIGAWAAVGKRSAYPYLADKGFNGYRWVAHWGQHYQAVVVTTPHDNARSERPWTRSEKKAFASHRQIIETVFARLVLAFRIKQHQAHSITGLYTRIAAMTCAYNMALLINRLYQRPGGSLVSLIC